MLNCQLVFNQLGDMEERKSKVIQNSISWYIKRGGGSGRETQSPFPGASLWTASVSASQEGSLRQSWNPLRVLFSEGEDGPAQEEEAGLGEQDQTWQEA